MNKDLIVKNRVDYYLLHASVGVDMRTSSTYQHEISLSLKNKKKG